MSARPYSCPFRAFGGVPSRASIQLRPINLPLSSKRVLSLLLMPLLPLYHPTISLHSPSAAQVLNSSTHRFSKLAVSPRLSFKPLQPRHQIQKRATYRTMAPQLDGYFKQVDKLSESFIERLRKAVAIPSVSADDKRRPDVVKVSGLPIEHYCILIS